MTEHILSTSQIESTLAHIADLETRIDLLGDTPEDQERAEIIVAQINDALDALGTSIPEKAERTIYVLRAAESEVERLRAAEKSIATRRARAERTVDRCKSDVLARLLAAHREYVSDESASIQTDAGTVYSTTSAKFVGPADPFAWPEQFQKWPDRPSVERAKAKKRFKTHPDEFPEGFGLVTTKGIGIK